MSLTVPPEDDNDDDDRDDDNGEADDNDDGDEAEETAPLLMTLTLNVLGRTVSSTLSLESLVAVAISCGRHWSGTGFFDGTARNLRHRKSRR